MRNMFPTMWWYLTKRLPAKFLRDPWGDHLFIKVLWLTKHSECRLLECTESLLNWANFSHSGQRPVVEGCGREATEHYVGATAQLSFSLLSLCALFMYVYMRMWVCLFCVCGGQRLILGVSLLIFIYDDDDDRGSHLVSLVDLELTMLTRLTLNSQRSTHQVLGLKA